MPKRLQGGLPSGAESWSRPRFPRPLLELSKSLPTGELGDWRGRKGKISGLERGLGLQGTMGIFLLSCTRDFPTTSRARGWRGLPCHPWKQVLSQLAEKATLLWPLESIMQVKKAVTPFCYSLQRRDGMQIEASGRPGCPFFHSKRVSPLGFSIPTRSLRLQFEPQGSSLGVRRVEFGRGGGSSYRLREDG